MATWKKVVVESAAGKISQEAATITNQGNLATLSVVGATEITDNTVGAAELNVSGNGTSGQALTSDADGTFSWTTISASDLEISNFAGATIQLSSESFADNDTSLMTSAAVNDRIQAISSNNSGTVTSVATGTGLNGTITSSGTITLDNQLIDIAGMTEAETTALAALSEDEIQILDGAAVSNNTIAKAVKTDSSTSGLVTIPTLNVGTGGMSSGVGGIQVTQGNIVLKSSINAVMGTIYAQTGNINVEGNVTVGGDLTVSGSTTTVNTETIKLADNIIELNSNASGTPSQDSGLTVNRGSSTNMSVFWDESKQTWGVGSNESSNVFTNVADLVTLKSQTYSSNATLANGWGAVGSFQLDGTNLYIRTA